MKKELELPTGGERVEVHRLGDATGPATGSKLNSWSALRDASNLVHGAVSDGHQEARRRELNTRTMAIGLRDPRDLLEELADRGLSWTTIARLIGVTPTAVRKWRRDTPISGENRRRLAGVLAFLEVVGEAMSPIEDPASWLEMPLSDEATVTPVDLFASGELDLLCDLASGRIEPHTVLDAFEPDWRTKHGRDAAFEVVEGEDGRPFIVERT